MKKMIMFTSLITTLTAAGTVLAMTGSPVKAGTLVDESDSKAELTITSVEDSLEIISVPDFSYGDVTTKKLGDGYTGNSTTTNQKQLHIRHSTVQSGSGYEGWKLHAKVNRFMNGAKILQVIGSLTLSDAMSPPGTLSIVNGSLPISPAPVYTRIAGTNDDDANTGTDFFTNDINGFLDIKALIVAGIVAGETYSSQIDWHLSQNGVPAPTL